MAGKKRSTNPKSSQRKKSPLNVINPNTAGIDLGSKEHWVCVPPESASENIRPFGCSTPDLMALADWLRECDVTSVAMESTGVEWIPLFQILSQRKFQVFLVNAKSVKTVPGRKSDVLDCQWLQLRHQQKRRVVTVINLSLIYVLICIELPEWILPPLMV